MMESCRRLCEWCEHREFTHVDKLPVELKDFYWCNLSENFVHVSWGCGDRLYDLNHLRIPLAVRLGFRPPIGYLSA